MLTANKQKEIKVLLVEDSQLQAELVKKALAASRSPIFKVVHCDRLSDALEVLQREKMDVILTDLSLPDAEGLETVRLFGKEAPEVALVVLTGTFEDEKIALEAIHIGAQDYLFKEKDTHLLSRVLGYAIERKKLQEAVCQARDQLELRVRERTAELEKANKNLEKETAERKKIEEQYFQAQKMEGMGRLAGGVAHDFNNLLSVIKGYSELLLEGFDPDDSRHADMVEIKNAVERAEGLTRQLLAFSRRQMVEPRVINLNETLRAMEKMLGRLIGEDIELAALTEEDLWNVKIDPTQVEQILVNLVVNARDVMPRGGKLALQTANVVFDENYTTQHFGVKAGEYVMIAVSDTGSGMSEEVKRHLFEPFFTTKELGKGTGLGLATVYGIVKQNMGHIFVYSEPEHGTTFKIYLPRVREKVEAAVTRPTFEGSPAGTETILLVEDDQALRKFASRTLQQKGYHVLEASNGQEALELLQDPAGLSIDLLVADMIMPKMGGKELSERLKGIYPRLKALLVSGYAKDTMVINGELDDRDNCLEKPFQRSALVTKVREILDKL